MKAVLRLVVPGLLLALATSGCSGSGAATSAPAGDGSSTAASGGPPKPPPLGACYRLDVNAALHSTSTTPAVPCTARHTSVTVAVGTVRPVVDGHLLALDSAQVQRQIATGCRRAVDAHVGGSLPKQQLSRVQAVWFNPTPEQADRGALWYRCDLVISAGNRTFASLPTKTKGLLSAPGAMNRWGTCGTSAPSAKSFRRVLCSAAHTWRARTTVALPTGTTYLATRAGRSADGRCHDVATSLSPKSTRLRWAFEWPTLEQWRSGQRYGFCWTPD